MELRAAVGRSPELGGTTPPDSPPLPTSLLRLSTASPRHGHSIPSAPRPTVSLDDAILSMLAIVHVGDVSTIPYWERSRRSLEPCAAFVSTRTYPRP
jgi:hypothetical protein